MTSVERHGPSPYRWATTRGPSPGDAGAGPTLALRAIDGRVSGFYSAMVAVIAWLGDNGSDPRRVNAIDVSFPYPRWTGTAVPGNQGPTSFNVQCQALQGAEDASHIAHRILIRLAG